MRSIKVGSACVRALLRRKRYVRHRLARVLFVATRVCPRRVAIASNVIKLKLTRRGNTLASMEKRPFPFILQLPAILQLQRFPMLFSVKNYCCCTSALLQRLSLLNTEGCK